MMRATHADIAWLAAPWADAALRFTLDPAADLDPAAVPAWPVWAPLPAALAVPAIRVRLGRFLVADPPGAIEAIMAACNDPRQRLALLPAVEARELIAHAAAWLHAPALTTLLRRRDVTAARATLGEQAYAFAFGGARLLPQPSDELHAVIGRGPTPGTQPDWLAAGCALFALSLGETDPAIRRRLHLREPGSTWSQVVDGLRDDPAGPAAFAATERLLREAVPAWSSLLH